VPPGGAPTQPERVLCVSTRAGAAPAAAVSRIGRRSKGANLHARLRPAPHSRRLMRAPLSEQGGGIIRADSRAGINSHMNVNDPKKVRCLPARKS
jgi:hypothetical protein